MKAVGARLPRYDGVAHVTGRTVYVDDVRVPGTLWVKALRSPSHHAAITRLDTSAAERMKGVQAIVTHADVPTLVYGHLSALGIPGDEPLLARDEVRYKASRSRSSLPRTRRPPRPPSTRSCSSSRSDRRSSTSARRSIRTLLPSTSGATGTRTSKERWIAGRSGKETSTGRSSRLISSSRVSTAPPRSSTRRSRRRCASSSRNRVVD